MYPIDWNHCDIDTFLQRLKSLLKRNGVSRVWIDFNWQCQTGLSTAYHSVLINCILEQLIVIQNDLNKVATLAMSVPCQTYCLSSVYVNQCTIWTSVAWVWNFSGYNMHHCIALQVAVIVAEANTAAMKRIIICAKIYCTWWNSVGNLVHIIRVYSAIWTWTVRESDERWANIRCYPVMLWCTAYEMLWLSGRCMMKFRWKPCPHHPRLQCNLDLNC
jgi:hypothetical protein